jgi:predicted nucleic acid-binding protein
MSVVDASVWVSLLASDDVNHAATARWFERQLSADTQFIVPSLVLIEIASAMTRRTGDASAAVAAPDRVRRLPEIEIVALTAEAAERAATIAARLVRRGADAVYVALAAELGVRLVTWDRQQRERSAASIQVSSPDDDLG